MILVGGIHPKGWGGCSIYDLLGFTTVIGNSNGIFSHFYHPKNVGLSLSFSKKKFLTTHHCKVEKNWHLLCIGVVKQAVSYTI